MLVEKLQGQSGWLHVEQLTVDSLDTEETLLITGPRAPAAAWAKLFGTLETPALEELYPTVSYWDGSVFDALAHNPSLSRLRSLQLSMLHKLHLGSG